MNNILNNHKIFSYNSNKEKNISQNRIYNSKTNYKNENEIKYNIKDFKEIPKDNKKRSKNKNIKDYSLELKTNYNQCYEKYEFYDNVDNYNKKKEQNKIDDMFFNNTINNNTISNNTISKYYHISNNNTINNYKFKNNNTYFLYNKSITTIKNKEKLNTMEENLYSSKHSLSENSSYYNSKKIVFNNKYKSEEIKSKLDKRIFRFSKIIKKNKSKNFDLISYLSNYNISSENFFDTLLKSDNDKKNSKNKIIKTINKNNENTYKNKIKKNNLKRNHKFWNIKSFNKNNVKNSNKNTYWNKSQSKNLKIVSKKIKKENNSDKKQNEEKEKNNDINVDVSKKDTKNYISNNNININKENSNNLIRQLYNDLLSEENDKVNNIKLNEEKEIEEDKNEDEKEGKTRNRNIKSINVKRYNSKNYKINKESNNLTNKKVNFGKAFQLKKIKTRNYQNIKYNLSNNNTKINGRNSIPNNIYINSEYYINDEEDSEENDNKVDIPYKNKYSLKDKISFDELSFLEDKKMDIKQKLKLIKKYKEKAVENLYIIVKENLEDNKELTLCIETLIKFLMIKSYKKYINIMKLLTAKGRLLSGISVTSNNTDNIKDEEIIKYIYRLFSDETSSYYLLEKSKNNNTLSYTSPVFLNNINLGKLSRKKYRLMNEMRDNRNSITKKSSKKYNVKANAFLTKFKKPMEENKDQKNFKQFMYEEVSLDKQRQNFLTQQIKLTNELRYQIQITHNKDGKERFRNLLSQIESMKNENMKDYIQFFTENFNLYREEIKELINDREKEERINGFIKDLLDNRDNISKKKETIQKKLNLADNRFESSLGNNILNGEISD